jgi:hypothetical protein
MVKVLGVMAVVAFLWASAASGAELSRSNDANHQYGWIVGQGGLQGTGADGGGAGADGGGAGASGAAGATGATGCR